MSAGDRKYNREQQARFDKNQTVLAPYSSAGCKLKDIPIQITTAIIDYPVMCPFCLHVGKIEAFLISTKKGFDKRLGKCPECRQQMMLRTLSREMTPEQFADWVYPYARSGFWQKCDFKKFNDRLYKIGWSYRFWARYKELKGGEDNESYEEWLKRTQEEERERQVNE